MSKRKWEPPEFEWSQLGPIPVDMADGIKDENGDALDGFAMRKARRIVLDSNLAPGLDTRLALTHEWLHVALYDLGWAHHLTEKEEELLVNGLSVALVAREDFHAEHARKRR